MSEIYTTQPPPNGRGCGKARTDGAPYACCGVSADGMPIEYFIIDPAIPWRGGWQRGVKILPTADGVNHMFIFVGKEFYPSPWDYIEETRRYGASRKLPKNLPFEKLTPGESRMVFIHARAIPEFRYRLVENAEYQAPLYQCQAKTDDWSDVLRGWHPDHQPCSHALRNLTTLMRDTEPMIGGDGQEVAGWRTVGMPSFDYTIQAPVEPDVAGLEWGLGAFLALPLTHFEFPVSADDKTQEAINRAGYETPVMEW